MMLFPPYQLAQYQASHSPQAQYFMGASAPESISLQQLLALADDHELQQWHDLSLAYSSAQGDPQLRELIAADYPGLNAANIVTFAGAQEAIFVTYHALLHAQDKVQVILPLYEPLSLVAQGVAAVVDAIELKLDESNRWQLDLEQWCQSVDETTRMAVINFPHNPTGKLISQDELDLMVERCSRKGCWLFSDEVFRGLEYQPTARLTGVASMYEKGISLGVMSKAYGLGGVRVGWIASQDRNLIQRMIKIKHYLSICNGRADEILAWIALQHGPQLLSDNLTTIQQNLQFLRQQLSQRSNLLTWYATDAGCVGFPGLTAGVNAQVFAKQLLQQTGVMVIPGDCFMLGDTHIRLGFGRRDFPQALQRWLTWLDNQ